MKTVYVVRFNEVFEDTKIKVDGYGKIEAYTSVCFNKKKNAIDFITKVTTAYCEKIGEMEDVQGYVDCCTDDTDGIMSIEKTKIMDC